jgi:hypothetical protein
MNASSDAPPPGNHRYPHPSGVAAALSPIVGSLLRKAVSTMSARTQPVERIGDLADGRCRPCGVRGRPREFKPGTSRQPAAATPSYFEQIAFPEHWRLNDTSRKNILEDRR